MKQISTLQAEASSWIIHRWSAQLCWLTLNKLSNLRRLWLPLTLPQMSIQLLKSSVKQANSRKWVLSSLTAWKLTDLKMVHGRLRFLSGIFSMNQILSMLSSISLNGTNTIVYRLLLSAKESNSSREPSRIILMLKTSAESSSTLKSFQLPG